MANRIRIYIEDSLQQNQQHLLGKDDSHYLLHVMRVKKGSLINLFNEGGEFEAEVLGGKRECELLIKGQVRGPEKLFDVELLFPLLKKDRLDFLIEKATELGVKSLQGVITKHAISQKLNETRVKAQLRQAAEQCERLSIPALKPLEKLEKVLEAWPGERPLFVCAERQGAPLLSSYLLENKSLEKSSFLVGPEGGFSESEFKLLSSYPFVQFVSLGPHILRAETAALSALTCWQSLCGNWIKVSA